MGIKLLDMAVDETDRDVPRDALLEGILYYAIAPLLSDTIDIMAKARPAIRPKVQPR
jgi:hypothetical protein